LTQDIKISQISDSDEEYVYDVEINEGGSATEHRVTLSVEDYEAITDTEIEPEELIQKTFEFMLDREPKESILGEFSISEVEYYFPEYREEIMGTE